MSSTTQPVPPKATAWLAPYWVRLVAFVIDAAWVVLPVGLFLITQALVGFELTASASLVVVAALVVAFGIFQGTLAWLTGGLTVGKAYCGLLVRRRDEMPLRPELTDLVRLIGRYSLGYAVVDVLGLGNLLAVRSPRRRTLHDLVFDTEVVAISGPADRWERVRAMERARQAGLARVEERWLWVLQLVRWSSWLPVKAAGAVVLAAQALKILSPVMHPVGTSSTSGLPAGAGLGPAGAAGVTAGATATTGALVLGGLVGVGGSGQVGVSFQHAGFEYAVLDASLRSHPPGEADAAVDPDPDVDHLMLHTRMTNPGVSVNAVRFSQVPAAETWALELEDGTVIPSEGLEELRGSYTGYSRETVPFGEQTEFLMSFPVPAGEPLENPSLVVQLFDYVPTVVALTAGEVSPTRVPVEVSTPTYDGPMGYRGSIALEVQNAWASREAGVDKEGRPLPALDSGNRQRAREGFVFVHFEVDYRPRDGDVVMGDPVPLVDGEPLTSPDIDHSDSEHDNTLRAQSQNYRAIIEVPLDADSVGIGFAANRQPVDFVAELDPGFLDEFVTD